MKQAGDRDTNLISMSTTLYTLAYALIQKRFCNGKFGCNMYDKFRNLS